MTPDELARFLAEQEQATERLLAEILERDRAQWAELEQLLADDRARTDRLLAEIEAINRTTLEGLLT